MLLKRHVVNCQMCQLIQARQLVTVDNYLKMLAIKAVFRMSYPRRATPVQILRESINFEGVVFYEKPHELGLYNEAGEIFRMSRTGIFLERLLALATSVVTFYGM